jgi:hypothetical protein
MQTPPQGGGWQLAVQGTIVGREPAKAARSRSRARPPRRLSPRARRAATCDAPATSGAGEGRWSGSSPSVLRTSCAAAPQKRRVPRKFPPCASFAPAEPAADLRTGPQCPGAGSWPAYPRPQIPPTGTRPGHGSIAAPARALPRRRRVFPAEVRPYACRPRGDGADGYPPLGRRTWLRSTHGRIGPGPGPATRSSPT